MTGREFAARVSAKVEEVAREEAARREFDIEKESFGLMRAMLAVLSNKELFAEAQRRAKKEAEAE